MPSWTKSCALSLSAMAALIFAGCSGNGGGGSSNSNESQTITFANPGTQAVGTPLTISATDSASLPVSFASTTASVCTVSGATATFVATGTCTIQATQIGNGTYAAATTVSQSFTVNGESQTITFANPGTQTVGTPLTLAAKDSASLPVSFASTTTSVCTVSGTTATFAAAGTCTIQATQTGNSSYTAATTVSQSFTVNLGSQIITFANPGTQTVGTPLTLAATDSASLPVSFASTTTSVCTVSGTTATFAAIGTCTIQAMQAGNSTYEAAMVSQSFTVNGEPQTITFSDPGTQVVGTQLTLIATASSGLSVSFASTTTSVCTDSGTTVTFVASGHCTIQATQAGNSTYAAATSSQSFTVNGEPQTITFANPGTQVVGTQLTLVATDSANLLVSFGSTTDSVCFVAGTTVSFLGIGTCKIQATQAGNSTYAAAAMVPQSFRVNGEPQTITFNDPGLQDIGATLTLAATAYSNFGTTSAPDGLPVSFASTTTSVCTVSGTTATLVAAGTCKIQATQAGDGITYAAATPVTQSFPVCSGCAVYVAGLSYIDQDSSGYWNTIATYWENGVPTNLTNGTLSTAASVIAVAGNGDIYVAGTTTPNTTGITIATYWKNGVAAPNLTDGTQSTQVTGIAIDSSGNVYITGYATTTTPAVEVGILWKNGVATYPTSAEVLTGIAIDSSDNVYVSGYSTNYGGALWKNGTETPIGDGDLEANAIAIDASGNIYVTCHTPGGPSLWKNGPITNLPDNGLVASTALSVAIDSSYNVYVVGYLYSSGSTEGASWKNGVLTIESGVPWFFEIAVDNEGNTYATGGTQGYYLNGTLVYLSNSAAPGITTTAYGITYVN